VFQHFDLGGGIGIQYRDADSPLSVSKYAQMIRRIFSMRELGYLPREFIFEPGRALVGNAGILLTQILYKKSRGRKDIVVVDAGMNDLMRPALYDAHHEILTVRLFGPSAKRVLADLVGPVCETTDVLARNRKFPSHYAHPELVAILSAGAYGSSMANTYNSRPRPAEILIDRKTHRIIRKRETFQDLVRGESL
jgi:diaminopimelate decarboxylase